MHAPQDVVVVTDNTLGIPGGEIDDGLALLYLLGCPDRVRVSAVCTTHGNATTSWTHRATCELARALAPLLDGVTILRGADAPRYGVPSVEDRDPSPAARFIAQSAGEGACLLSLGAVTDLAAAEELRPGTLAAYSRVAMMGGTTGTLVVGGRIMDELNFSVDSRATYRVFSTAGVGAGTGAGGDDRGPDGDVAGAAGAAGTERGRARLLVADAWSCLPLTFDADAFLDRLGRPGMPGAEFLRRTCVPWFEHARDAWNTHGFVAWDVLAAMALAEPELVQAVPYDVALNERLLGIGYLERAGAGVPAASVHLVAPKDPAQAIEHIYQAWERALGRLAGERG